MRNPRIHTEQLLAAGSQLTLEPGPSAHIARALRLQVGDALTVFNGRGGEYAATISTLGKKSVTLDIGQHRDIEAESPLAIHLGIAISRGDRMDWLVQKATELGVETLSPLLTARTEVKLKADRAEKKQQHWQQIAIATCEQCTRNRVPQIMPLQTLQTWLAATQADQKFVLHHRASATPQDSQAPATVALLAGPEGGLSPVEIALAEAAGYQSLKLGARVMRTETAPLAAMAILQAQWGDMSLP